ncbi:small nucleolar ribonucleoprotein-like protein complex subunit [Delitschia confertaspora ATCC 74209]|uniref:Small nucleolar ribonucleoprotein-like protein complex subunit n=1 Tax=Delitschia confertaspora ATCC 74209 TaxID=1513339 RepID=A0A9P4MVH1_9PLEO|nr:small nucleolar ribonucleoprotein-like protein complex subunit [Delitschia confertaspora ATCC 74209]
MSSFFTTPASQRKRKRIEAPSAASKKRNVTSKDSQPAKPSRRKEREESISGSESEDEERTDFFTTGDGVQTDSDEDENETAAEKRLRLAERYLENIRNEVVDEAGFDAAEIDKDLIAERLKEDVAETKGRIYRHIADKLDFETASHIFAKSNEHAITGCAAQLPYIWTISKDLSVVKWEAPDPKIYNSDDSNRPTNITPRRKPKRILWKKGNKNNKKDPSFIGHTGAILSIAISDSGKYLATGDEDARLIIWDADTLTPKKMFTQHRGAVTSLSFRRGTEQLFSASTDRTIKIWSASELAYVETLFGHQDSVVDIAGGLETNQETCVSVGSRDRTARLWKVVEESQLVFRGGGTARHKGMEKLRRGRFGAKVDDEPDHNEGADSKTGMADEDDDPPIAYAEGSMDCVAMLEAGMFVTGSDNGALCLWSDKKKKPVFTLPLAHGRDPRIPAEEMSADANAAERGIIGPRLPRYITAIATVPFADLIITASWDGWIRAWKVGPEKRTIEELGPIGKIEGENLVNGNSTSGQTLVRGIVNGLSICERGERGADGLCIVAAVGKEHRLGRWMKGQGRNGIEIFEVLTKKSSKPGDDGTDEETEA